MAYELTCLLCKRTPDDLPEDSLAALERMQHHLAAAHQVTPEVLAAATTRTTDWGWHELLLPDGRAALRIVPVLTPGAVFESFTTWGDMMSALNTARADANEHLAAWVHRMGPGDHVIIYDPSMDLLIYGELLADEPGPGEDPLPEDYRWGRWFSVCDPDGAIGSNHLSVFLIPITRALFERLRREGWPETPDDLHTALRCIAEET